MAGEKVKPSIMTVVINRIESSAQKAIGKVDAMNESISKTISNF
jgi:hypothetical protein